MSTQTRLRHPNLVTYAGGDLERIRSNLKCRVLAAMTLVTFPSPLIRTRWSWKCYWIPHKPLRSNSGRCTAQSQGFDQHTTAIQSSSEQYNVHKQSLSARITRLAQHDLKFGHITAQTHAEHTHATRRCLRQSSGHFPAANDCRRRTRVAQSMRALLLITQTGSSEKCELQEAQQRVCDREANGDKKTHTINQRTATGGCSRDRQLLPHNRSNNASSYRSGMAPNTQPLLQQQTK